MIDRATWLGAYFIDPAAAVSVLQGSYNYWLVSLSIVVAIFTSTIALQLVELVRQRELSRSHRATAIGSGALALGIGIWSMHFIGMLAFDLCAHGAYDPLLTLISAIPGILASGAALTILARNQLALKLLLCGGVLVGAGIGSMHYIGMAAMETGLTLRYDPIWFFISIVVAVMLAIVALTVRFSLQSRLPTVPSKLLLLASGTIMGLAIAGMHYTGMISARFIGTQADHLNDHLHDNTALALAIAVATTIVTLIVLTVNLLLRYRLLLAETRAHQSRLNAIVSTAVDGIITIDANGIIQSANDAVERILGWRLAEILGENIKILMPPSEAEKHDSYLAQYIETGERRIIGGDREVYARHKAGHDVPIRLAIGEAAIPGRSSRYVGFITDISERRAMEKTLRERERQYRSLMTNMPGIAFRCLLDEEWSVLLISEKVEQLTGWRAQHFVDGDITFARIIHPDDLQHAHDVVDAAVTSGDSYNLEYRIQHRLGHTVWVWDKGSFAFDADGKPCWIDGVLLDISERHKMEEALRAAMHKAEAAAHAKAAFLANMSHEIRTPMNAIIGFGEVLNDTELNDKQQAYLRSINSSARSLLYLINDILDSAKLEQGELALDIYDFDLKELLDGVIATFWLQACKKGLQFELNFDERISQYQRGAGDRIRQILINLAGNAVKFTESGSVIIHVEPAANQSVCFRVVDTGIGIAADRLELIFDPFVQADSSMSRVYGGTGLGTAISKQLTELMGGNISVTSELGQGSCFQFTIPLVRGDQPKYSGSNGITELPTQRILIIDDIPQNLDLLELILERQGHAIKRGCNGFEAVALYQSEHPDLIIMDIQMPGMDGLTAAQKIREIETQTGQERIPIIAFTASVLMEDREAARAAGMDGFANKPVEVNALTQEMARVLQQELTPTEGSDTSPVVTTGLSVPAAATSASAENSTPLVDWNKGLAVWGDKARFMRELAQYEASWPKLMEELTNALGQQQLDELKLQAHCQKGVCGNLSLPALARGFALFEQALQRRDVGEMQTLLAKMDEQRLALAQLLASTSSDWDQASPGIGSESNSQSALPDIELIPLLEQLQAMANQAELHEATLTRLLAGAGSSHQASAQAVATAFEEFDFDRAGELLEAFTTAIHRENG